MGGTFVNLAEAVGKTTLSALGGFETGGPIGALLAGIPAAVSNTGTLVHRLSAYFHPTDKDGTATAETVHSLIRPMTHMDVATKALGSVSKDTPPAGLELATVGAKLHDGMAKHGDYTAASQYAGATPIAKHIGTGVSRAVVDHARATIGFDAQNHMRYGASATREAQMVPSTSAYHEPVRDFMLNGGAEALAMKRLSQGGGSRGGDIVITGAGV